MSVKNKGRDYDLTIQCSSVTIVIILSSKDSAAKWLETISPPRTIDTDADDASGLMQGSIGRNALIVLLDYSGNYMVPSPVKPTSASFSTMVQSIASTFIGKSLSSANASRHPTDVHRSQSEGAMGYGSSEPNAAQPRVPPRPRQISTPWDLDDEDGDAEEEEPIYEVIKSNPPIYVDLLGDSDVFENPPNAPRPDDVSARSSTSSHILEITPTRPELQPGKESSTKTPSLKQATEATRRPTVNADSSISDPMVGVVVPVRPQPLVLGLIKEDDV